MSSLLKLRVVHVCVANAINIHYTFLQEVILVFGLIQNHAQELPCPLSLLLRLSGQVCLL